jgi:hypothetical protein
MHEARKSKRSSPGPSLRDSSTLKKKTLTERGKTKRGKGGNHHGFLSYAGRRGVEWGVEPILTATKTSLILMAFCTF